MTAERTHYKKLIETQYLGQWDLMRGDGSFIEPTVVIEAVERYVPEKRRKKRMPDGSMRDEALKRIKIHFKGKRKPWLSGPATQNVIAKMYGAIIQDWVGKAITLYVDPDVEMGREKTGGIRVRSRIPNGPPTDLPLDNPVDEAKQKQLDEAAGREPGDGQ